MEKIKKRIKAIRTLLEFDECYSKETAVFDLKELEKDVEVNISYVVNKEVDVPDEFIQRIKDKLCK